MPSPIYGQIDANKRRTAVLIGVFVLVIVFFGWLIGRSAGSTAGFVTMAIIFSGFSTLFSYFVGDKIALFTSGARPVTKEENIYLHRMIENLAITAGLPKPAIYIIQDPTINAFATGRDPKHASIAVTTGAIEKLKNEELEGVLAHELSHIGNFDIRVMMLVVVLVGAVALMARMFLRGMPFGGRRGGRDRDGAGVLLIIGLVLAILMPLVAQLIKLAVSRRRESLADASGALLTRYPEGLARALEKISADSTPMARANEATAHLYFSNPFGASKMKSLFSTHPPIAERIKALRAMT